MQNLYNIDNAYSTADNSREALMNCLRAAPSAKARKLALVKDVIGSIKAKADSLGAEYVVALGFMDIEPSADARGIFAVTYADVDAMERECARTLETWARNTIARYVTPVCKAEGLAVEGMRIGKGAKAPKFDAGKVAKRLRAQYSAAELRQILRALSA